MNKLVFIFLFTSVFPNNMLLRAENLRFSKQGPLNFGLVIKNGNHTIYRSERLGNAGLVELARYLKKENMPFPKTILHLNRHGFKRRLPFLTLFALQEYESQKKFNFRYFHPFNYKFRTYLDGRNPYEPQIDIDGKKYLNSQARKYFGTIDDNKKDGGIEAFMRVMNLILGAKSPVLFHCTGGRHRTGMVAMAIRYLQGGQWIHGEKYQVRIGRVGPKVELNPAQYEYYLHNKVSFRRKNIEFVEEFYNDQLFSELEEKYRGSLTGSL